MASTLRVIMLMTGSGGLISWNLEFRYLSFRVECHVDGSNVSVEPATSVIYSENGGCSFL